ncbi:MAG: DUF1592 domain-containing protein [Phycisphaerales bacterium JB063]
MGNPTRTSWLVGGLLALGLVGGSAIKSLSAQDTDADVEVAPPDWLPTLSEDPAQVDFTDHAQPILEWYCMDCHDRATHKGGVVLDNIDSERELVEHFREWEKVVDQIEGRTMPPMDAEQPDEATRQRLAAYLRHVLETYEPDGPPDPGPTMSRRLTHFEYNNTVRDLTGIDLRPGAQFPAEGGGGEGFTNNADTMFLSPLLMEKYLDASHQIVNHLEVSFTLGLVWHADTLGERDRQQWRDAAQEALKQYRHDRLAGLDVFVDDAAQMGRYVPALYRYRHAQLADESLSIEQFAQQEGLHAVYLHGLNAFYAEGPGNGDEPVAQVVAAWRALPEPDPARTVEEQNALASAAAEQSAALLRQHVAPLAHWFGDAEDKRSFVMQSGYGRFGHMPFAYNNDQLFAAVTQPERDELKRLQDEDWLRRQGNADHERDALRRMLGPFVRRAYRRPLEPGELDTLVAYFDAQREVSSSFEEAVRVVVRRVLVSPYFLLRVEHDRAGESAYRISDVELASRLSYLLWASMPDEALLSAAETGRLSDAEELERQVRRMLADPKSSGFAEQMLGEWLGLPEVARTDGPDVAVFPVYDSALRDALVHEARLFLASLVQEGRPTLALIDADYTYANAGLASHYGLPFETADGQGDTDAWRRVATGGAQRGGVLGMGAFHLLTSYPTRASPVLRGQWVLGALLGSPTPPPPPNVGELPEGEHAESMSFRERLAAHRADPACAVCHDRLDPVGFSMQRFDALGRWVETDPAGQVIDDHGTMPDGTQLDGVGGLRDYLIANKDRFYRQIARKTLGYALGRELQYTDRPTLRRLEERLAADDSFATLLIEVAQSYPFQHRRPATPGTDPSEDSP